MNDEIIVTMPVVSSPFMEEIHAAFDSIQKLENLFLSPSAPDLSSFYHTFKRLVGEVTSYVGPYPIPEIDELLKNTQTPYVPTSLVSFYTNFDPKLPQQQGNSYTTKMDPVIPPSNPTVDLLKYPQINSVQFSLIDTKEQIESLISTISSSPDKAIGVSVIDHYFPNVICVLCISTRDCEYLIDVLELPDAITSLAPIFSARDITKVFGNAAHCCKLLHQAGISDIYNSFDVTTAAQHLNISTSLEDLTQDFRNRLQEGWIPDSARKVVPPPDFPHNKVCDSEKLSQILTESESNAMQDWRIRPLSLSQMRLARQRVHYLLYLYDSLRLKLTEESTKLLDKTIAISHHKASMDWTSYRTMIISPNGAILAAAYGQPIPSANVLRSIKNARQNETNNGILPQAIMSDAALTWCALTLPTNQKALDAALIESSPKHKQMYAPDPHSIPKRLSDEIIKEKSVNENYEIKSPPSKTLDEIVAEIGWVPSEENLESPKRPSEVHLALDTTVSPRVAKSAKGKTQTPAGAYLRHLRDPDQPTSVSRQIDGIPRTEAQIFALANNVRLLQKINGKTKTKLAAAKEETLPDESPEDVLRALVGMNYIDEADANQIKAKMNAPKPTKPAAKPAAKPAEKRGRSKDSKTHKYLKYW
ncbi:3'-5' exonuclease family protein [Trichomonas vaginalis G3]|uniref:3'-5' exonuclease family protein n=1 Tax=Trichomonas vaginalis (strain ATCC PRA-98 / G3) TaxID=412133 RepID=A2DER9_TRIV3|nr:3'-5' exonuclease protein [Trichomonas vaginalis G3]EAY21196.1 3'-5' exonuclease family protein [Trichomonas vaginalis G3]KAI5522274.1 3'-5' exonuclease protein [Trichomonas vaginalis G3]|eukprot:XP_001582182.1 3'-5' exonuclease family protein [Trichomonas vaginalis G3]